MKTVRLITCAAIAGMATGFAAYAEEFTLGSNYVRPEFTIGQFGDDELDDIFGAYYGAGATANLNLAPHLDLQVGGSYIWANGERNGIDYDLDQRAGGLALAVYPDPFGKATPYVFGDVAWFDGEAKARGPEGSVKEDSSDETYGGGVGVQIAITPKVLFDLSGNYGRTGGEDDWFGDVELGYWITDDILASIDSSYDFESEDTAVSFGVLFRF